MIEIAQNRLSVIVIYCSASTGLAIVERRCELPFCSGSFESQTLQPRQGAFLLTASDVQRSFILNLNFSLAFGVRISSVLPLVCLNQHFTRLSVDLVATDRHAFTIIASKERLERFLCFDGISNSVRETRT